VDRLTSHATGEREKGASKGSIAHAVRFKLNFLNIYSLLKIQIILFLGFF
jgi:hypothetical protein